MSGAKFNFRWAEELAVHQANTRNPMTTPLSRKDKRKLAKTAKRDAIFKLDLESDINTASNSKRRKTKEPEQSSEFSDTDRRTFEHYSEFAQIMSSFLDIFDDIEANTVPISDGEEMVDMGERISGESTFSGSSNGCASGDPEGDGTSPSPTPSDIEDSDYPDDSSSSDSDDSGDSDNSSPSSFSLHEDSDESGFFGYADDEYSSAWSDFSEFSD
ncbi:hypothetical protein AA313_de0209186 [Arthrobotrys entomopaga]|nr:hypothetical protein AA313_de0209186 [Arthrobotrys entomopaga]